jgi:hypothetical protein
VSTLAELNGRYRQLAPFREEGLTNGAVNAEEEALDDYFQKTEASLALMFQVPAVGVAAYFLMAIGGAPWPVLIGVLAVTIGYSLAISLILKWGSTHTFPVLLENRNRTLWDYAAAQVEEFRNGD